MCLRAFYKLNPDSTVSSAAKKGLCCLEISARRIFSLLVRSAFYKLWKHRQTSLL